MAPTKTEVKKGNRKKGGTQKRIEEEEEEENQRNADLGGQIQGEMERAQDQGMIQEDKSGFEEDEEGREGEGTEGSSKQEEGTTARKIIIWLCCSMTSYIAKEKSHRVTCQSL